MNIIERFWQSDSLTYIHLIYRKELKSASKSMFTFSFQVPACVQFLLILTKIHTQNNREENNIDWYLIVGEEKLLVVSFTSCMNWVTSYTLSETMIQQEWISQCSATSARENSGICGEILGLLGRWTVVGLITAAVAIGFGTVEGNKLICKSQMLQ